MPETPGEPQVDVALPATKEKLQEAIAPLATRHELEFWFGALSERVDRLEHRMDDRFAALERQMAQMSETLPATHARSSST